VDFRAGVQAEEMIANEAVGSVRSAEADMDIQRGSLADAPGNGIF